ncbi:hypothetical protein F2Q69_00024044 [Brassica cretica]|uniref:Uncharacterized protein n=1 Tax=Brassica cretica TaxID=69181 RepID=A0A8S9Q7M9_BRACR|nr:hypothetical protein F2Q69_00024044 [Brassica cretica]
MGLQIETQSCLKRKNRDSSCSPSSSPSCVIDSNPFNSDESSNDSWSASSCNPPSSSPQQQQQELSLKKTEMEKRERRKERKEKKNSMPSLADTCSKNPLKNGFQNLNLRIGDCLFIYF